jgi:hypothetical protein
MSYASKKGYRAEHAVEEFIQRELGDCYRPRAGRANDVGDIVGLPLVISVKDHAHATLGPWIGDLQRMVYASDHTVGLIWHKRIRTGDPGHWYLTTTPYLLLPMVRAYVEACGK